MPPQQSLVGFSLPKPGPVLRIVLGGLFARVELELFTLRPAHRGRNSNLNVGPRDHFLRLRLECLAGSCDRGTRSTGPPPFCNERGLD